MVTLWTGYCDWRLVQRKDLDREARVLADREFEHLDGEHLLFERAHVHPNRRLDVERRVVDAGAADDFGDLRELPVETLVPIREQSLLFQVVELPAVGHTAVYAERANAAHPGHRQQIEHRLDAEPPNRHDRRIAMRVWCREQVVPEQSPLFGEPTEQRKTRHKLVERLLAREVLNVGHPGHNQRLSVALDRVAAVLEHVGVDDVSERDGLIAYGVVERDGFEAAGVELVTPGEARPLAEDEPRLFGAEASLAEPFKKRTHLLLLPGR